MVVNVAWEDSRDEDLDYGVSIECAGCDEYY